MLIISPLFRFDSHNYSLTPRPSDLVPFFNASSLCPFSFAFFLLDEAKVAKAPKAQMMNFIPDDTAPKTAGALMDVSARKKKEEGNQCNCEIRFGRCSDKCNCDPEKCRTRKGEKEELEDEDED